MTKVEALAQFLECDCDEVTANSDEEFSFGSREEYLVLTEEEADDKARDYILDSVWAFRPEFLAAHCDLEPEDIETIQSNDKCEGNNKILTKLINDVEHFVDDAIKCDGRGHFMSSYDDEEHEVGQFLIYRTN